jgi:type VI secretion system protein ImpE
VTAADEALKSGDLAAALAHLQAAVRKSPAELELRFALAEVLMALGQWDRCATQLSVVREMDALALPVARLYERALETEKVRTAVFAGERSPLIFGEPAEWVAMLVQALSLDASGHAEAAARLRGQALEQAGAVSGSVNGAAFEWIADADSRLGPVLEAVIDGNYYWIPFERIQRLQMQQPANLRDAIWAMAQFTWTNSGEAAGLIPVRYVGTETASDDRLRLARLTDWVQVNEDTATGLGQRVLVTDSDEYGLLDVRELVLQSSP